MLSKTTVRGREFGVDCDKPVGICTDRGGETDERRGGCRVGACDDGWIKLGEEGLGDCGDVQGGRDGPAMQREIKLLGGGESCQVPRLWGVKRDVKV